MSESQRDLELSVRGANLAKRVGATTVGELARFTADELLSLFYRPWRRSPTEASYSQHPRRVRQ